MERHFRYKHKAGRNYITGYDGTLRRFCGVYKVIADI